MNHLAVLIVRVAAVTSRPDWTLNAISWLIAAAVVVGYRSAVGG
jgi:hypothetical protein